MAKKKAVNSEQLAVDSGQAVTAPLYSIGAWSGLPQYRCGLCEFDTLDEPVIIEHVEMHKVGYSAAPPPAPPQIQEQDLERGDSSDSDDVFEVELVELDSTMDAQGNEHKKFTIKE